MNFLFFYFFTGEHDVRVLTLAEQFIAAMPDHIKVCQLYTIFTTPLFVIYLSFNNANISK